MKIKEIFEKAGGTINFEQFQAACGQAKFVDLSEGGYVSKSKYDDELKAKDSTIETLNGTISQRDTDLADIKQKLETAGVDAQKLSSLTNDLATLQGKYNDDVAKYQEKLTKQAYEFAVKEFAATKKFSSNAAKRDFISSLINENLKMNDKNEIMGANDFVQQYTESNSDAFVAENEPKSTQQPSFVQPTSTQTPPQEGDTPFKFNFVGVR